MTIHLRAKEALSVMRAARECERFYDKTTGVEVSMRLSDARAWIGFSGTRYHSSTEVLGNLRIWRRACAPYLAAGESVHSGFARQYDACRKRVRSFARGIIAPREVIVFGHSRGGATACLCACDFARNPPWHGTSILMCITFGAPAAGNVAFARAFERVVPRFRRIVTPGDVVPVLLPRWLGYEHARNKAEGDMEEIEVDVNGAEADDDEECCRHPLLVETEARERHATWCCLFGWCCALPPCRVHSEQRYRQYTTARGRDVV